MLSGKTPTINGDGRYNRDYVYAADVARANYLSIERGDCDCFNIGTGVETDVNQLYDMIAAVTGFGKKPAYGPARPGDLRRNFLNMSKAERIIGWRPGVSLKEGLEKTVEYFKNDQRRSGGMNR